MASRASRVLITGIAGFGGRYLAESLRRDGRTVLGLEHPGVLSVGAARGLAADDVLPFDLASPDLEALESFVKGSRIEEVYHLAAIASVRLSWDSLRSTVSINSLGTLNLLEALRRQGQRPSVLLVGSADQYGIVPAARQPLKESVPCRPRSPYALSKLWQEEFGVFYAGLHGWPVILTRTFNHTGPRQSPTFVCSDFARQVALIEAGRQEPVIRVGNLKAVRDFLDVRDVVEAYRLLMEKAKPGVPYNVASGRKVAIAEVLRILLDSARVPVRVEADPERRRPADIALQWGDPRRLRRATGWRPSYRLGETLSDLLEYWRAQAGGAEGDAGAGPPAGGEA